MLKLVRLNDGDVLHRKRVKLRDPVPDGLPLKNEKKPDWRLLWQRIVPRARTIVSNDVGGDPDELPPPPPGAQLIHIIQNKVRSKRESFRAEFERFSNTIDKIEALENEYEDWEAEHLNLRRPPESGPLLFTMKEEERTVPVRLSEAVDSDEKEVAIDLQTRRYQKEKAYWSYGQDLRPSYAYPSQNNTFAMSSISTNFSNTKNLTATPLTTSLNINETLTPASIPETSRKIREPVVHNTAAVNDTKIIASTDQRNKFDLAMKILNSLEEDADQEAVELLLSRKKPKILTQILYDPHEFDFVEEAPRYPRTTPRPMPQFSISRLGPSLKVIPLHT